MTTLKEWLRKPRVGSIHLVPEGDNPEADILLFKRRGGLAKAKTKTVDGVELPAKAFAYVPDPDKPSTWKLPLYTAAADVPAKPDAARVGAAAAALGPGGHRGRSADIPAEDRGKVIAAVRSAWLRAHPDKGKEDLPDILKKGRQMNISQRFREALAKTREILGGVEPGDAVRKALYDEVRAQNARDSAADILMRRLSDLADAFHMTLFSPEMEGEDRDVEKDLLASLKQFSDEVSAEIPDILAGKIAKAIADIYEADSAPPDPDVFAASVGLAIQKAAANSPTGDKPDDTEGNTMKGKREYEARVAKALELADLLETKKVDLDTVLSKMSDGDPTPDPAPEPDPEDIVKGLPKNLQDLFEKHAAARTAELRKENDQLKKDLSGTNARIEVIEKKAERELFAKSISLKGIPTPTEELVELLFDIEKDKREKLVKILSVASEVILKGIPQPLGSDLSGETSAWAKINAMAQELQKDHPEMTIEKARSTITNANPELARQYREERSQAH